MMKIASALLLLLISLSVIYTLYATDCTWVFFRKKKDDREHRERALPPVSIIQPLSGVEINTLGNVLSHTGIWVLSLFLNTVHWKNRRFRALKGGGLQSFG